MKTIYISMATIDDTETIVSINNAFETAKYPERVRIGLSCFTKDFSYYENLLEETKNKNVDILYNKLDPTVIKDFGTGLGRTRAISLYKDEDYILQVDPHTHFDKNWDEYLIDLLEDAKKELNHEKIVLTAYAGFYKYNENMTPSRQVTDSRPRYAKYIRAFFMDVFPMWDDFPVSDFMRNADKKYYPEVKFNGNFAFGDKEFAKNPGIYKEAFFYDEEIIQAVNLIWDGFYLVYPNTEYLPITHLYSGHINSLGGKRMFMTDYLSEKDARLAENLAKERYRQYLINPENKQKIKKYEKYARINLKFGAIKDNHVPEKFSVEGF